MKATTAAKHSAFLCFLFLIVYGSCNVITAYRTDVLFFYFEWERHIPFVQWMIVPYMSIDLFFIAAPFICRDEKELSVFTKRISFTILVAGMCFLLCPLTFAFERPPADGWLGVIFNNFRKLDLPYNQLPSLHIVLRTILAVLFAKHAKGILRIASSIWFSLIGFSAIFTHQHHIIDIFGGFILAVFSFYLFPDSHIEPSGSKNRRVGFYYGSAGAVLLFIAIMLILTDCKLGMLGALLFWPALSLILVSGAYFGLGAGVYRKANGKIPLSSWLMHAPSLLGQRFSLLYYKYKSKDCAWNEVTPHLLIGRQLSNREAAQLLQKYPLSAVLDLTAEFTEAIPFLNQKHGITYLNMPILDLTAPTHKQLDEIVKFIEFHSQKGIVYVHCKAGYSRCAGAVGAYLLHSKQASSFQEVAQKLKSVRPFIVIRAEIVHALNSYKIDFPHIN